MYIKNFFFLLKKKSVKGVSIIDVFTRNVFSTTTFTLLALNLQFS